MNSSCSPNKGDKKNKQKTIKWDQSLTEVPAAKASKVVDFQNVSSNDDDISEHIDTW